MTLINNIKQFPIYNVVEQPSKYMTAIAITAFSSLVMFLEPVSTSWLRYQSIEVNHGEWWRIFTANLCHSNWNHWILNIAGLWLMDVFYKPVLSLKIRTSLLLFCMLSNVALLHAFLNIGWYVGLSGALHGYLIGGAILSFNTAKVLNTLIIVITTIKLITESLWQVNSGTAELIGADVLEPAHSFGAVSAVIFVLIFWIIHKKTT